MLLRQVWSKKKKKMEEGREQRRTSGPGWGHGHTCWSLHVIYYLKSWQQSEEFKEMCNEKFLIQRPESSSQLHLHPPSLPPASHSYIRLKMDCCVLLVLLYSIKSPHYLYSKTSRVVTEVVGKDSEDDLVVQHLVVINYKVTSWGAINCSTVLDCSQMPTYIMYFVFAVKLIVSVYDKK